MGKNDDLPALVATPARITFGTGEMTSHTAGLQTVAEVDPILLQNATLRVQALPPARWVRETSIQFPLFSFARFGVEIAQEFPRVQFNPLKVRSSCSL